jgi:sugar/nucleoside kinase (ribokinase family)
MTIYDKLDPHRRQIAGVGSALVDVLAHEDDAFLQQVGAIKGGMTYVEDEFIDRTIAMMSAPPKVVPGGSACNTVVGVSRLGGKALFVGKCGRDPLAHLFRSELEKQGVESLLFTSDAPTGRVLSIITPDAQRSMFTFLGASAQTLPQEMTSGCFAQAAVVLVEGYLLFNRELIQAAFKEARQAGALICLDLASFTVVAEARDILPGLISDYVDILLANEDEAYAYTGIKDHRAAVAAMAATVDIAALKIGSKGSLIAHNGEILTIKAKGDGRAVDTTGAGDLWASGFLFGLVRGMPLPKCAEIASLCGFEVCQVVGASIPEERWKTIHTRMEKI